MAITLPSVEPANAFIHALKQAAKAFALSRTNTRRNVSSLGAPPGSSRNSRSHGYCSFA
jgi:hypothetical protein